MASNLVENFFGAINTISQANVDAAKRDETIDAEIVSLTNAETGEYRVTYQGNTFSATASDPTTTYSKGDRVYVLVPRGDFSAKKIILGRSDYKNSTVSDDLSDLTNFYIVKGPNWLDWYKGSEPLQICAVEDKYKTSLLEDAHFQDYGFLREIPQPREAYPTVNYPTSFMTDEEIAEADEQMQRYSKVYDAIMIQASFRTEFASVHTKGQYMLRVQCIQDNAKYIDDKSHPDFKQSKGEEWLKKDQEIIDYMASIDWDRYDNDSDYRAEVDTTKKAMEIERDNLAIQKKYTLVNFDLGFKQFSGAPYAFVADTPQKGYYTTKNLIRGLYSISLFQDGQMVADIIPTYLPDGSISYDTQNSVLDKNNIFCDSIDIRFAEKVNLVDQLYYPWIETPYGNTLYDANSVEGRPSGRGSVQLIAHLQHGLQDLIETSPDAIEVHWFRQKSDVTSATPVETEEKDAHGNTWYDYGGPGWYPIEKLIEEGAPPPDSMDEGDIETAIATGWQGYDIDFNVLTIRKEAVQFRWVYKAVIVYRDMGTSAQSEINRSEVEQEVIRLDSKYDLKIEQFVSKDGRTTSLRILDQNRSVHEVDPSTGENYREWFGTWWLELQDGSYTRISDPYWYGPLEINDFLLNDIATFHVQCYDPYIMDPANTGVPTYQIEEITTLSIDIISADDESSLLCTWVGRDTFNYDALGVIKDWAADKDNTLEPEISWAEGRASDYKITIIGPDGVTPLSNREYYDEQSEYDSGKTGQCETSMMKNMWVDFENTIHFQVENQYDKEKTDNTFTVRVETVNGQQYDFKKTVFFTKDGDMGTIGAEWSAQIKPCNWKHGPDDEEGAYLEPVDYVAPLVIDVSGQPGAYVYRQNKYYRTFLRPFVKKNGIPLEQMDPMEGYYYKVYWDVRMPGSAADPTTRYASWLRLYHADGTVDVDKVGSLYGRDGTFYENGGVDFKTSYKVDVQYDPGNISEVGLQSEVNPDEKVPGGLIGFSLYPSRQYGNEDDRFYTENYGAVEVRFFDNQNEGTGANLEQFLYRFIVKAQVDIMKGEYDQGKKMIKVEGNSQRINSITSYWPVDVILNYSNIPFNDPNNPDYYEFYKKIATNWPQFIAYNATGYDPAVFPDEMYFKYGPHREKEETNYRVFNLTPLVQSIEEQLDPATQKYKQYYRAKPHLNMTEGFWGALKFDMTAAGNGGPFESGEYIRNQVLYLNAYGNVDINGWDGQGIDMNEENGTIFATTIGAGFKRPSTNAFTGVLMGADRSQPRQEIPGYGMAYDREAHEHMPYLTGIFGYQDGVQSFALMENGTAYFGRADRGGRIIIDGANATIYGGANGQMGSPSIDDDMWNSMRLTLCDLTHKVSAEGQNVSGYWTNSKDAYDPDNQNNNIPIYTGIKNGDHGFMTQGMDGRYFGYNNSDAEASMKSQLPYWYGLIWQNAYIKPNGLKPYWLEGQKYEDLPYYVDIDDPDSYSDTCMRLDYFWGNNGEDIWFQKTPDDEWDRHEQLTGFGPARASTTPAIEVGQHKHGLMPGLLPWCDFDNVFMDLSIPGDRNFMVTYDGTLWAMNGIFLGVIIGSNIVGGRIQGAEIGIGHRPSHYEKTYVMDEDYGAKKDCEFTQLEAPYDALRPIDENGTPGKCEKGQGLGFYVDTEGNVIANSMKIYGGSIYIGRFHIMGGDMSDQDYGHMVQIAESDFVGPVHFYGNVGIGPALNYDELPDDFVAVDEYTYKGNLFQTRGIAALGIPLPKDRDTRLHLNAILDDIMRGTSQYEAGYSGGAGESGIGEGTSLEQNAMFAIDTANSYLPESAQADDADKLQGHFWPLHYHYGYTKDRSGVDTGGGQSDSDDQDIVKAYVTTMDIFKSKGFEVNRGYAGGIEDNMLDGSNYWRLGPYGTEAQIMWIKKTFQPEQSSIKPQRYDAGTDDEKYLGWFGFTNRAGGGASTEAAIGITSWYTAPIIVSSDGESAWTSRGHFHMFVRGLGTGSGVVDNQNTWKHQNGSNNGLDYGIVFDMGSNLQNQDVGPGDCGGNKVILRTAKGPIGFGQEKNDNGIQGTWTVPGPNDNQIQGFLYIDPENSGKMAHEGGIFLGTRKGNMHIYRLGESGICTGPHVPELYLEEKKAMLSAPTEVYIGANWTNGHTPLNCIKMTTKEISFEGSYATPENQKNIYARFA